MLRNNKLNTNSSFFFQKYGIILIFFLLHIRNHEMKPPKKNKITQSDSSYQPVCYDQMQEATEAYLDLWQQNLKHWATDPQALQKWIALTSKTHSKE